MSETNLEHDEVIREALDVLNRLHAQNEVHTTAIDTEFERVPRTTATPERSLEDRVRRHYGLEFPIQMDSFSMATQTANRNDEQLNAIELLNRNINSVRPEHSLRRSAAIDAAMMATSRRHITVPSSDIDVDWIDSIMNTAFNPIDSISTSTPSEISSNSLSWMKMKTRGDGTSVHYKWTRSDTPDVEEDSTLFMMDITEEMNRFPAVFATHYWINPQDLYIYKEGYHLLRFLEKKWRISKIDIAVLKPIEELS